MSVLVNVVGGGGLVGLLVNVVGCLLGLVVVVKLFFWLVTKPIQKVPCPPPLKEEREEKGKERTEKDGEVCLVTGGGGYLGKALLLKLVENRQYRTIRVVDLAPSLPPSFSGLPVEYFRIDLIGACKREGNHQQQLEKALDGVTAVFHLAGLVRLDPQYNLLYNLHVSATANFLNTCTKKGITRIVHTSSVSVMVDIHASPVLDADESHPLPQIFASEYAETKAVGEKLYQTHATKIRHALLRSAPIYGKEDPILIAPLLRGEVPFLPAGGERQCWVYIDNCVQAHIKADQALKSSLPSPPPTPPIYFITDGGPTNAAHLILALLSLLSSTPPSSLSSPSYSRLPSSLPTLPSLFFRGLVEVVEGLGWVSCWWGGRGRMFQVTRSALRHIMCENWYKIDKAKRDFGYSPISSEEAVKEMYQKCLETRKTK